MLVKQLPIVLAQHCQDEQDHGQGKMSREAVSRIKLPLALSGPCSSAASHLISTMLCSWAKVSYAAGERIYLEGSRFANEIGGRDGDSSMMSGCLIITKIFREAWQGV